MAAIMQVENPGNPRMETRLGFGIGIGLDLWRYVTLVRTSRGASRRVGVRYKLISSFGKFYFCLFQALYEIDIVCFDWLCSDRYITINWIVGFKRWISPGNYVMIFT